MAYLDNNSTTQVLPSVLNEIVSCYRDQYGNSSSLHTFGHRAQLVLSHARVRVAQLLDCHPLEVIFTSGGTEGNNWALKGLVKLGEHVVISAIEHSAILQTAAALEKNGCAVTRVGVDANGRVNPEDVRRALQPNTKLISVMMANNETGVLQPVEEIGAIAAEADVWFHTDAVQAAGKVPISVGKIRCDLLTITAHKMHGPQGVGALYVRRGTPIQPLLHGGHQEKGRRPGTENIAGIAGFGKACDEATRSMQDGAMAQLAEWRNRIEETLVAQVPQSGVNGKDAVRVPNTTNIYFDGISGDSLVLALDRQSVAVSRGAACMAGDSNPSSVLMAMGLSGERSRSSIRISLSKLNQESEIERLLAALPEVVRQLRTARSFQSSMA
ncbi:MAG: cysteine desulfurase family protein [Terracidiphilus sp.]|nr:cysteine desulfurase family protein [Terracidiphilus sp.]